ncbi:MAG: hypothetical protein ABL958_08150 [Bdellovibrionia bacterium]
MKKIVSLLMIALLTACAPESKPNLLGDGADENDSDDWSAEALEFDKVCTQATPSAATQSTIKLILAKTGAANCLEAAEKIIEAEELDLSGLAVADVTPLLAFKSLKGLYLSDTGLSAKSAAELAKLEKLEKLDLSENELSRVPALPLGLKQLDLSGNEIERPGPALAALSKLEKLSLRENEISNLADVPLSVVALDVGLNPVEKDGHDSSGLAKFGRVLTFGIKKADKNGGDPARLAKMKNLKDVYLASKPLAQRLKKSLPKISFITDRRLELE